MFDMPFSPTKEFIEANSSKENQNEESQFRNQNTFSQSMTNVSCCLANIYVHGL
jgi:hypothetical protein